MNDRYYPTPKHLRRVNAALALREVPDFPAALEQLSKAYEQAPGDADVLLALGLTYQDLNQPQQAERYLRKALGFAPDSELVRAALAGLLISEYRYDDAISLLEPLIERKTSHPDIWYHYATSMLDSDPEGGPAKLLQQLETAFATQEPPQAVSERLWQARVANAVALFESDEALKTIEAGLGEFPHSLPLRKEKARALVYLGRFTEALQIIERLRAEGLPEYELRQEETAARLGTGQSYESVVRAAHSSGQGLDLLTIAMLLFRYGRLQAAAVAAEDALQIETHIDEQFALELALILAHGGKPEEARTTVDRVLAGDFTYGGEPLEFFLEDLSGKLLIEIVLAHIALVLGQFEKAIQHYREAESVPDTQQPAGLQPPVVCCYHGQLTSPLPKPKNADAMLRSIRANLATTYCLKGDLQNALTTATMTVETPPAPKAEIFGDEDKYTVYAVLGCVHLAAGDAENARQAWEEGLRVLGDVPDLQEASTLLQQWLADLEAKSSEHDD